MDEIGTIPISTSQNRYKLTTPWAYNVLSTFIHCREGEMTRC